MATPTKMYSYFDDIQFLREALLMHDSYSY
jgi:hypothetical protein